MHMPLPTSIENCPLVDALIEIRFEPKVFKEAVFGLIYQQINSDFPDTPQSLPILQLPEPLRAMDPNLKFKPYYRLENKQFVVQIGPDVMTVSSRMPYVGWGHLKSYAENVFSKIFAIPNFISTVSRLGIRYISVFETNVIDKINVRINFSNPEVQTINSQIRVEIPEDNFISILQVISEGTFNIPGIIERNGTIVDIDTCRMYGDNAFIENFSGELEKAHKIEKTMFFSLLEAEFLNSLKPIYDDQK